jgi:hypothetical protein
VASHVNLLGYRQSIIDLDAEVTNRGATCKIVATW